MFTNIILFMVAIFLFHIGQAGVAEGDSLVFTLTALALNRVAFAFYCRFIFQRLARRLQSWSHEGPAAGRYQSSVLQCSILALLLYVLELYGLDALYWLQHIPWIEPWVVLQGTAALALFLFYLGIIWFFGQPVYQAVFQARVRRPNFIFSNFKLAVPVLIPWAGLVLLGDLLPFLPWPGPVEFYNGFLGQTSVSFVFMVFLFFFFLPRYLPYWWGCRPFPVTEKTSELTAFLKAEGFRYRGLLRWPLFEGRMLTAGIMGILPRYRYLLVTDGLMEALSPEELKAVLAHEMGHARHHHMLFYFVIMFAFIIPWGGTAVISGALLTQIPVWQNFMNQYRAVMGDFMLLIVNLPSLLLLFLFFRFVLGYFMRHFERQADLYSVTVMGTPAYTIQSLEKIALLSGRIRELPSWHHFSIKQRVDYLAKTADDKGLIKKYNRFIRFRLVFYFAVMIGLSGFFAFSPTMGRAGNVFLLNELHQNPAEAIAYYENILNRYPDHPLALNNLAWFLLTAPDPGTRDPQRALSLARKAVALEKTAEALDTLAEAYYANGFKSEAVQAAQEALAAATGRKRYYEKQLERFEKGFQGSE